MATALRAAGLVYALVTLVAVYIAYQMTATEPMLSGMILPMVVAALVQGFLVVIALFGLATVVDNTEAVRYRKTLR